MMKRLCALMLALVMMLGTAALAEEPVAEESLAEAAQETAEEAVEGAVADVVEETVAEAVEEAAAEEAAETIAEAVEEIEGTEAEEVPDTLLVTVNGQEIRENNELLQFWIHYYEENSGADPVEYKDIIRQYSMDYTIHYSIIAQELEKAGVSITKEMAEERLRQEWDTYVNEIMEGVFGLGENATDEEKAAARENAIAYITMYTGYTEENFMQELPMATIILLNEKLSESVADQVAVTDQEVEDYFNALVEEDRELIGDSASMYEYYPYYMGRESYYIPEGYRGINHILLEVDSELLAAWQDLAARFEEQNEEDTEGTDKEDTEETAEPAETVTQEMVDAAKQAILDSVQDKIDEITAKLEAGVAFDELIQEYGTDPGMLDEATRAAGYAVHADSIMWEPNFISGAMKLEKVGDISEPVIGSYGVHILQYLRDIPGGAVEFTDDMKAEIRETLEDEKLTAAIDEKIEPWMEEAEIVWTEEGEPWKLNTDEAAE